MFSVRCGLLAGALLSAPVLATPFEVPVDPNQSTLYFQLCISGTCDTDSSPVSGTLTIALDSISHPAQIEVHDFDLHLDHNLQWYISWGVLGYLTADATSVAVSYAYPGTPLGPVPVTNGAFALVSVPVSSAGVVTYHAVGLPCAALQGAGYPCDDTRDLANQDPQTADQFSGSVTSQARVVALTSQIDVTSPLDPNFSDLATIHVYGTVRGQVYVPVSDVPGDLNCDQFVNADDVHPFVLALNGQVNYEAQYPDCRWLNADCNEDGQVNFADINPFVALLLEQ